ncbi:hypothetical protein [Chitinophaga sp.]|uniref:hypothetical protein n=1 Tax=Chitinophaga sp. TaxID=1869181 RepID=UPI0031D4CDCB
MEQESSNFPSPEIPEHIFTESVKNEGSLSDKRTTDLQDNINMLFTFLDKNLEVQGYDDAMINPDTVNLQENIAAIKSELLRTIRKVKTFYESFIREINFHIESRGRSGMVDTVEELKMKKQIAEDHIKKVIEIETDTKNNEGDSQGLILSYTRGFKNGLAAISHHNIIRKDF